MNLDFAIKPFSLFHSLEWIIIIDKYCNFYRNILEKRLELQAFCAATKALEELIDVRSLNHLKTGPKSFYSFNF